MSPPELILPWLALTGGRALFASLFLLGVALFIFPLTLHHPLIDPDEGLHAAIAQEMVERGDYIVPRFLGKPFPDKPVFFFWAMAGSLRLLGFSEPAVRAPGLAFGLLGAITTGLLAGTILGRRGGWLAGIFYATLALPIGLMQVPVHDLALVPFTNGALLAFWRAARSPRAVAVLAWSLAAGGCLGLAMVTKGLSGVAIVGLAHATVCLLERRLSVVVVLGGVLALALAAAVAAPAFLAMEHAQPGYLKYYLFERHVLGAVTTTQRHGKAVWHYYLPVVLGGGLPWVLYAPFSLARLRSRARDNATDQRFGDATRLGWSLLLTGTLFLSLSKSKLLTYALPVFPAIAVLAAVAWLAWLERGGQHPSRWFARMRVVQAGIGAMILPAALVFAPAKFPVPHVAWMWVVALTIAGGWWTAARLAARRLDRAAALGATSDRGDGRRVTRDTGAAGGDHHDGARFGPGDQPLGAIPAGAVDGRATPGIAGVLPRSRVATRAHGRSRSPVVEPAGARARAGAGHAGCRHSRGLSASRPVRAPRGPAFRTGGALPHLRRRAPAPHAADPVPPAAPRVVDRASPADGASRR